MNSRLHMPGAMPSELAELLSDVDRGYTQAEEVILDKRSDELLQARIDDVETFKDFASDAASQTADEQIHRALMNLDKACDGDEISRNAVLSALTQVQKSYRLWCDKTFRDECREEAEGELDQGGAVKLPVYVYAQWCDYRKEYRYSAWSIDGLASQGYVPVQSVEIEFDEPPHETLVNGTVELWKAEQKRIEAEAHNKITQLQRQINEMLCIEYKPEPA